MLRGDQQWGTMRREGFGTKAVDEAAADAPAAPPPPVAAPPGALRSSLERPAVGRPS
jgi:hypothetical protein